MSDTITASIALIGTLTGSLIGFQIARRNIKDQFFYAASAKLKQAFIDVLRLLNLPEDKFIDLHAIDVMEDSYWKHELAVIEFRYALPKSKRPCFDRAWENYKGNETGPEKLTKKYFGRDNWQQEALNNIEEILIFAEHDSCSFLINKIKKTYNIALHRIAACNRSR